MESSPKDKEEAIRHSTTIESLAQSEGIGLEDVRSLYESVLDKMKREAVITDFLPIFAARKVKEILRVRGLPQTGTDYPRPCPDTPFAPFVAKPSCSALSCMPLGSPSLCSGPSCRKVSRLFLTG